jgi:hypothetical protein
MNKTKIDKFIEWIKEPSTVKAIIMFIGLIGVTVNPEHIKEIITGATILYGGIAAFIDKN